MRITVVAIGSRGDVEPLVALAGALDRAGHRVRIGTAPDFAGMVEGAGLDFVRVGPSAREVLSDSEGRKMISGAGGVGAQAIRLRRLLEPVAEGLANDLCNAVDDAEALLFTPLVNVGDVTEQLGVPSMLVSLWPKNRTSAFPAVGFPEAPLLGGPYNRLTHVLLEQLAWRPFQRQGNRIRHTFGQLPLRWNTPLGYAHKRRQSVLYGFSESVVPRPPDWGPWLHMAGYWFNEPAPSWSPPADLVRFLDAGEPPVVITFGSMASWDPTRLARVASEALARSGRRGVLVGGFDRAELDDDRICYVPEIPYHWLLPRAAAVVHHGGAGTTAATLRAGVPSVIVPFFGDQPFWARRVVELGAGTKPIRGLSAAKLTAAIRQATSDPGIAANAARVGRRLRAEDGLSHAVNVVERHFEQFAYS
ncbi:MAG: glycosyltransferase [Streptosporangiales bacterium]|nr:glycosyltransferase [Streptosporangiales bacterium]